MRYTAASLKTFGSTIHRGSDPLIEKLIEGAFALAVRRLRAGAADPIEFLAKIPLLFVLHEFGRGRTALMMRAAIMQPAIQAAMQIGLALRAYVAKADRKLRGKNMPACVTCFLFGGRTHGDHYGAI